ncbi:hypothetical protein [Streptomyces palmae]|uniref:Uncharacterized protein n=1 Tax=Streptomyces palmae TaxID=1701085 RepID=A0A4Z0HEY5_9ACTN|nr:hypothetical protein [Streptomyces palmae]TGB17365.1 hypothetical protein E4099_03530 [Streptomyces palmae]
MAIELKTTDDPLNVEIHDETGHIGNLFFVGRDEEDPADEEEGWTAELWGFPYAGVRSTAYRPSAPEAFAAAGPLYEELLEARRTAERFHRNQPVRPISTPMGGQPR